MTRAGFHESIGSKLEQDPRNQLPYDYHNDYYRLLHIDFTTDRPANLLDPRKLADLVGLVFSTWRWVANVACNYNGLVDSF